VFKQAIGTVHANAVFSRRARVLGEAIRDLLPMGSSVLDVGTGDGTIARLWKAGRPDLRVEGIDVFVRPNPKIPVSVFDGRTLPFADGSFDIVTFVDVLHHADDARKLLHEAARVARKSVVIKDHYAENWLDDKTLALMDWVGNAPHGVALPYKYWSRSEWNQAFNDSGLSVDILQTRIPLYPLPLSLAFGRNLHFLARLQISG